MTEAPEKSRRGRPRPQNTVDRDEQVHQLLKKGGLTKTEIADKLGIAAGEAYLSLFRLNKQGRVAKAPKAEGAEGRSNTWEAK
jgi:predicted ArsR family transcriptional regulator